MRTFVTVVDSSLDVTTFLAAKLQLESDEDLLTFDIKSLYPNLECHEGPNCVGKVVSDEIDAYYIPRRKWGLADMLVRLMKLLLLHPIVALKDESEESDVSFFLQESGLTTGLSCA